MSPHQLREEYFWTLARFGKSPVIHAADEYPYRGWFTGCGRPVKEKQLGDGPLNKITCRICNPRLGKSR